MKKAIAILLALMMCVSYLVGCGSNEEASQPSTTPAGSPESAPEPAATPESTPAPVHDATLAGFYTLIKYEAGGTDLLGIAEDSGESTLFIYIEFRDDGTALYFFMDEGDDVTYNVSGNQVTLLFDVDGGVNVLEGIIEDDTITFEQDGLMMVFKQNPEFQPGEFSLDEDIIPPGFYTLIEVKTEDGEDLMPNVVSYEEETGISVVDANHIKILKGNRYEQCAMQFKEDFVLACGEIYMEGNTIIIHEQWEEYDDDFFEAELNGDLLIKYVDDVIWVFQRNDDYSGRE